MSPSTEEQKTDRGNSGRGSDADSDCTPPVGMYRECADCGSETFRLWRRTDLNPDHTAVTCADCGNSVGTVSIIDPRYIIECPECSSEETEPFVADFDWWCSACRCYFDSRDMTVKGEIGHAK